MRLEDVIDTATLIFGYASVAMLVTVILFAIPSFIWRAVFAAILLYAPFVVATAFIYAAYALFGWIGATIASIPVAFLILFELVKMVQSDY